MVYTRATAPDGGSSGARLPALDQATGRSIAPAVTPLVIGFTLLLIVIFLVGYSSVLRIDIVGEEVLSFEEHYAAEISFLLNMRLALTGFNNEKCARESAQGKGLHPPFDMPLNTTRQEMKTCDPPSTYHRIRRIRVGSNFVTTWTPM